jgi:predicted ester cyclase
MQARKRGLLAVLVGTYADRVRRYYQEAFVARNWDYVRELIAPHARVADGIGPDAKIGPLAGALGGFTDVSVDIRHLVEGGNQVAVHFVLNATDTGGFLGRQPTGLRLSMWGVEFWRFDGEQVVEEWIGNDWLSTFIQLGVLPSPWPAATGV